jgi:hypothetical protein
LDISVYYINLFLALVLYKFFLILNLRDRGVILRLLALTSLIQLPLIIIERLFYQQLVANFTVLRYEDAAFGSFHLANDHSLGFFLLIVFLILLRKKVFRKFQNAAMIWIGVTIVILNSLITIVLFSALLIYLLFKRSRFSFSVKLISVLIGAGLMVFLLIRVNYSSLLVKRGTQSFKNLSIEERPDYEMSRFQEIVLIAISKKKIIGDGAFSYYNVRTGEFKLGSNYSQLLWFYHDLGIIGLLFFFLLIAVLTLRLTKNPNYFLFFSFLIYSFFTTTLMDVSFIFCYFFYQKLDIGNYRIAAVS